MLTEIVVTAGITTTMFRPGHIIIGSGNIATIESIHVNAVTLLGHYLRSQYVHEEDVAAFFRQALLTDLPARYNLIPDDHFQLSQAKKVVGEKLAPKVALWLARLITHISWRYFGASTHPSWLKVMLVDFTLSNAKQKSTG
jgi:hypothetical protein